MLKTSWLHYTRIASVLQSTVKALRSRTRTVLDRQRNLSHETMGAAQSENSKVDKADLVTRIKAHLAEVDQKKARELGGVYLFNVIKGTTVSSLTLDLNQVTAYHGEPEDDPDVTFTLTEHYFKQLVLGKEAARNIIQAGKCSVTGDIMRAMKLEPYFKV